MNLSMRILLILSVFILLAGVMVVSVNGASKIATSIGILDEEETEQSEPLEISGEVSIDDEPEYQEDRDETDLFSLITRWILSAGKNMFIIAVLVVVIVLPKSLMKQAKKAS